MRALPLTILLLATVAACTESPVAPEPEAMNALPSASALVSGSSAFFSLTLGSSTQSPSEAWGVMYVRTGLAPPNPCNPIGWGRVQALSVCAVLVNPAFERIDAMTFEVTTPGGVQILRAFVSAPPNPCNVAVLTGILPAELGGATEVTASIETDAGIVVSSPPGPWPGGSAAPPNPCALTVTLG